MSTDAREYLSENIFLLYIQDLLVNHDDRNIYQTSSKLLGLTDIRKENEQSGTNSYIKYSRLVSSQNYVESQFTFHKRLAHMLVCGCASRKNPPKSISFEDASFAPHI